MQLKLQLRVRRWLLLIPTLFGFLLLAYLGRSAYLAGRTLREYRRHPDPQLAENILKRTGTVGAFERLLMIVPGIPIYDLEVKNQVLRASLPNTALNRYLYRTIIDRATDQELVGSGKSQIGEVFDYPYYTQYAWPRIRRVFSIRPLDKFSPDTLAQFSRDPDAQSTIADLVMASIRHAQEFPVPTSVLNAIASNPHIDYGVVIPNIASMPNRGTDERETWSDDVPVPSLSARTLWQTISSYIPPDHHDWDYYIGFCSHIVNSDMPESGKAKHFIQTNVEQLSDSFIEQCTPESKDRSGSIHLESLFKLMPPSRQDLRVKLFQQLAAMDLPRAESLLEGLVSRNDPSNEKDLIISLANAGSTRVVKYLDSTFVGTTRPTEHFSTLAAYVFGPKVSAEYERLAHHGYLQTGKSFPPTYIIGGPTADEASSLAAFAARYPWFPGADDAIYRSAYSFFRLKQYSAAWQLILNARIRGLYDGDADDVLKYLARAIAERVYRTYGSMPVPHELEDARNVGAVLPMVRRALFDNSYTAARCRHDAAMYTDGTARIVLGLEGSVVDITNACIQIIRDRDSLSTDALANEEPNTVLNDLWPKPPPRVGEYLWSDDRPVGGQDTVCDLVSELIRRVKAGGQPRSKRERAELQLLAEYLEFFEGKLQKEKNIPRTDDSDKNGPPMSSSRDRYAEKIVQLKYDANQALKSAREVLQNE